MTYGTLGASTSLIYNVNVASSITTQGRALISSASLQFEMFLDNNVKFGSLDEVLEFINHVVKEKSRRRFRDDVVLDNFVSTNDCFAKIIFSCGYRWIPNYEEMDIIYKVIENLSAEDKNRVFYKNNLYYFIDNSKVWNILHTILMNLKQPILSPGEIPEEVQDDLKLFNDLLTEYVYYGYLVMDRIDRCDNMIKTTVAVSDTDSAIITLDGWYRYVVERINGEELRIANYTSPLSFDDIDEETGEFKTKGWQKAIKFEPKKLDYNFFTDEVTERERFNDPTILPPNENVKYTIINIMSYVLGNILNDYMDKTCLNQHSLTLEDIVHIKPGEDLINKSIYYGFGESIFKFENGYPKDELVPKYNRKCRIRLKNEFTFLRLLMVHNAKKNYASLVTVQEGNFIPENKQLDIKGIEILTKSTKSSTTREALQKILLEDIMKSPVIDQIRFLKDIAIFEKSIVESLHNGNRQYYKPAVIKSLSSYENPMRIQGIKGAVAWNAIRSKDLPAIDLEERNAVSIAKIDINKNNISQIAGTYPEVYNNMVEILQQPDFKTGVTAISIPMDIKVPDWLMPFIDYDEILRDNIAGFPFESLGIQRMEKNNVNYTNIVQL